MSETVSRQAHILKKVGSTPIPDTDATLDTELALK
ncbi:hypothetical protein 2AV2_95 [Nodularia phage vB_NpeS-2AV2]|uniref:Uncharacterized protein n=1 Tax=Nodularia phage vB_NpeS-2AV2 TaxID=1777122 RepID=A0A1L2BWY8_9CAUD|nr:hypothetical protein HWA92_gp095 [Nodularia phage vB_NpeS-2AV2]ALY07547.1 hypothetical protein 2AV2_95 [Nodularia phage vB_NpeS-2AV2]